MIARITRWLWCVMLVAAFCTAALSIHFLHARIGMSAAGLIGIGSVLALHPLAIAINFLASRVAGDALPHEHRLSPWRALRMFDAEIDASARGLWFANPFLAYRPAPCAVEPARRWSILFVHGYFCNRAVWHSFMRDAAARGYRCEAVTLPDPFAALDLQVDAVEQASTALQSDGPPVVIVAHSMGGLVARALMRRLDAARVAHVITLGSPHHGTWTARFGKAGAVRDMRIDSPWLQALDHDERDGRGLRRDALTSIWSRHDDVVFPQSSAQLEGATDIAIDGCGHVALLYDAQVRRLVFERLTALQEAATS